MECTYIPFKIYVCMHYALEPMFLFYFVWIFFFFQFFFSLRFSFLYFFAYFNIGIVDTLE